jgi:predicted DNA-binding transcriptional regulator YafY
MESYTKTHRILRLILCLSTGYHRTKDECTEFLGIKDTAFYSYCNLLRETGFDLKQKDGRYWIDCSLPDSKVLLNILHFSEEELFLLSRSIDILDEGTGISIGLKSKLVSFLNHDKVIDDYLARHKSEKVRLIREAIKNEKQVLLVNYSSGNSESVRNRLVEPFEFKDDFNLVWAYDVEIKQNRQFKVSRIEEVREIPINWEFARLHRSKPVDIFRNTGDLNKEIDLILNIKARNLLIEEYPMAGEYLVKVRDNRFGIKVSVAKYEGPGRFVLGLADCIEVRGDKGFMDFLCSKT